MGLDITVMIVDWSWMGEPPPRERLTRLREAWGADETGLWEHDAPVVEGDWLLPRGRDGAFFGIYEFRRTLGSFKAHFWAGERWESFRGHVEPLIRGELDALLRGLIRDGPDGDGDQVDPGIFTEDPTRFYDDPGAFRGVLLARSPDSVRELAALWERIQPRLGELQGPFTEHVAAGEGWIGTFDSFTDLMEDWGRVVAEAARRGWGVVGLSE